jgi:hypothetical protein
MPINTEQLAYWYLRLNGFLTTQNFIVHPDSGSNAQTEADVLGVRFPYRAELSMTDDAPFTLERDRVYIIMAEVKKGACKFNDPWKEPQKENLQRVLRSIGAFRNHEVDSVAKAIYTTGAYSNSEYHVSLACFGKSKSRSINRKYPKSPQILWNNVLSFIYKRFRSYHNQKSDHGQWDEAGKYLWNRAWEENDIMKFTQSIIAAF